MEFAPGSFVCQPDRFAQNELEWSDWSCRLFGNTVAAPVSVSSSSVLAPCATAPVLDMNAR